MINEIRKKKGVEIEAGYSLILCVTYIIYKKKNNDNNNNKINVKKMFAKVI